MAEIHREAEEAMGTTDLDRAIAGRRGIWRWTIVIGSGAIAAIVLGLATALSIQTKLPSNTQTPPAAFLKPEKESLSATFELAPSPVIEPNRTFFFGTGDGSNGYYAERPLQKDSSK
jgi:hypothetical protein